MVMREALRVIKVCLRNRSADTEEIRALSTCGCEVQVQTLDHEKYGRWMRSSGEMPWHRIIDVYCAPERETEICDRCRALFPADADIYVTEIFRSYRAPVDGAEVITSCYLWNYRNEAAVREQVMAEHFEMEKLQVYYDYVVFQTLIEVVTAGSPVFDFFFVSHVSDPSGIDTIYSTPALSGMREHSMAFLNTDTRLLSFGVTHIFG